MLDGAGCNNISTAQMYVITSTPGLLYIVDMNCVLVCRAGRVCRTWRNVVSHNSMVRPNIGQPNIGQTSEY